MQMSLFLIGVLVGGLVLGSIARLVVPGEQRISLSTTTLVGIAGAAIGFFIVNLVDSERETVATGIVTGIGALAGSVIVLALFIFVSTRWGRREQPDAPTVAQIVRDGESATVEFKSTARTNLHTGARDPAIELLIARTVAGFLNAEGGTLIIGVDDAGKAVGLELDLKLMKQPDLDRYELWLTDYLEATLGKPALAFVSTRFGAVDGEDVVAIDIAPAAAPVFLNEPGSKRTADFYVRMGNSTRKLLTDEFATYRHTRWK